MYTAVYNTNTIMYPSHCLSDHRQLNSEMVLVSLSQPSLIPSPSHIKMTTISARHKLWHTWGIITMCLGLVSSGTQGLHHRSPHRMFHWHLWHWHNQPPDIVMPWVWSPLSAWCGQTYRVSEKMRIRGVAMSYLIFGNFCAHWKREKPEFSKTHPTFVFSSLLKPSTVFWMLILIFGTPWTPGQNNYTNKLVKIRV